jgi:hypothetical protein
MMLIRKRTLSIDKRLGPLFVLLVALFQGVFLVVFLRRS